MKNKSLDVAVPIYISNLCDSECTMCNMSKKNEKLIRIDGSFEEVIEQLDILYQVEGVRWVMILSGEYKKGEYRQKHLKRIVKVVNKAFQMGFERVTINIGALDDDEIDFLYENFDCREKVGLAVFQETYNREIYQERFGDYDPEIPKTDYDRRYLTPDKWLKRGFSMVNLGILVGVGDPASDVNALIAHSRELLEKYTCTVQISLPRIVDCHEGYSDSEYIKIIHKVKEELPEVDIILTTRESKEFLEEVLTDIDVLSPGTSEVLGYTKCGDISNDPDKSQFYVKRRRERPSEILDYFASKYPITFNYIKKSEEKDKKQKVFISTPITNALDPETGCFDMTMASQINRIAEMIRKRKFEVFLAIEEEKWGKAIATSEICTVRDFRNLKEADKLVVYLTTCFSEGTLIEVGWASAWNIPVTILCQRGMKMSPLVEGLSRVGDNRIYHLELDNEEDIDAILSSRL